jgi:hypothetical protein
MDQESNNVPNLDAMPASEVWNFWRKHQAGRNYRKLFPKGGRGTKRAAANLAHYAANKGTAMNCRLRGEIQSALMYEGIAERIYAALPSFAQW